MGDAEERIGYYRYEEHEADKFALEMTHNNQAGGKVFTKLAK